MPKKRIIVVHSKSKRHQNKFYDYGNSNKYRQKTENSIEKCEKNASKPFKP